MTEQIPPGSNDPESGQPNPGDSEPYTQEVQHSQISALVPDHVAQGVFSTGAVVLNGNQEFILDFLLRMTKPQRVAARVVLPPSVVARFITALRQNLDNYIQKFGEPKLPQLPQPQPQAEKTTAQELYEQLKLPDDVLSGAYANAVMIGHTATEFSFDFITNFFPRSAVAARVYLAAPNVPRFLESLTHSFQQFQRKMGQQPPGPPPDAPPAPPSAD